MKKLILILGLIGLAAPVGIANPLSSRRVNLEAHKPMRVVGLQYAKTVVHVSHMMDGSADKFLSDVQSLLPELEKTQILYVDINSTGGLLDQAWTVAKAVRIISKTGVKVICIANNIVASGATIVAASCPFLYSTIETEFYFHYGRIVEGETVSPAEQKMISAMVAFGAGMTTAEFEKFVGPPVEDAHRSFGAVKAVEYGYSDGIVFTLPWIEQKGEQK